jgi:two-component system chemotaxis sensor kinase CheA
MLGKGESIVQSRKSLLRITVIGGLVFVLLSVWGAFRYVNLLAEQRMDIETAKVRQSFSTHVNASESVAESFKTFLELLSHPDETAFQKFSEQSIRRNDFLKSAIFYKAVPHSKRNEFEASLGSAGKEKEISESAPDSGDGIRRAEKRDLYLPIYFADSEAAGATFYGWDLLSDPQKAEMAKKAFDGKKTQASRSFLLDDGHAALEVFVPIQDASGAVQGLVGLTIDVTALLGEEEWRRNVTVSLSMTLAGSNEFNRLYRSLDTVETKGPVLATLRSEINENSFGQILKLEFERKLDFFKVNSFILLMAFVASLALAILAIWLIRALSDLSIVNAGLERTVAERTKDLRNVLDNLDQGFFTFDRNGTVGSTVSRGALEIFGNSLAGQNLATVLRVADKAGIDSWLEMLFDPNVRLDFKSLIDLGPNSFSGSKDRFIAVSYFPVYKEDGKALDAVICVGSDKTQEKKLEGQIRQEQDHAKMILSIVGDRSAFADFVEEIRDIFQDLDEEWKRPEGPRQESVFRGLHTIKGGSAAYSMTGIASLSHELESLVTKGGAEKMAEVHEGIVRLKDNFDAFLVENENIIGAIGDQSRRTKSFTLAELSHWGERLKKNASPDLFDDYQTTFILDDFGAAFSRFNEVMQRLASTQDKMVQLALPESGPRVRLSRYKGLMSAFIHVFRNSVDHGLEDMGIREAAGKDPSGTIRVGFEQRTASSGERALRIIVQDDGKGIDPQVIRKKAIEKELRPLDELNSLSDEQVIQLVFENGFSTRDTVTEVSGRGVGLDALRFEAMAIGGNVGVRSEVGKGSYFWVDVPWYRD